MRVVRIRIHGMYKMPFNNHFSANALVMPLGLTDSMRDDVLKKYHDTFYVFDEGDPIVGEHRTFEVFSFDVIDDMEVSVA